MCLRKIVVLLIFPMIASAQKSSLSPEALDFRKPVQFTHVPILLLRINPSQLFGYNNTLQYGVEVAPPFGPVSFAFDYGSGKGKGNFNKDVKNLQASNKNRELRGEIRAYFSDLYPFYALDRKPFGRYYAIEYVNGTYERTLQGMSPIPVVSSPDMELHRVEGINTVEKTHVVHLKLGRHIHLHKHLFLDVYGGLGMGFSKMTADNHVIDDYSFMPVRLNFVSNKIYESPKANRTFFSKTFGVRVVVPI